MERGDRERVDVAGRLHREGRQHDRSSFDWFENGEVELLTATGHHVPSDPDSAEHWKQWTDGVGALVCGRTLFDFTGDGMGRTRWTCRWSW